MKNFKVKLGVGAFDVVKANNRQEAKQKWDDKHGPYLTIPLKYVTQNKKK